MASAEAMGHHIIIACSSLAHTYHPFTPIAYDRTESDKKIADVVFDFNRRFASLTADYEMLLASLQHGQHPQAAAAASSSGRTTISPPLPPTAADEAVAASTTTANMASTAATGTAAMHSLSQVAGMHLQRHSPASTGEKRGADEMNGREVTAATQLGSSSKKAKVDSTTLRSE